MWIARFLFALALLLPIPVRAISATEEVDLRRQEEQLLHRRVDLSTVQRWQPETRRWIPRPPPAAPLLLVHLWAVECKPCLAEMPQLGRALQKLRSPVRAILVSETLNDGTLQDFLLSHAATLGGVEHYRITDGKLRAALRNQTQPLTLLIDQHMVVRQAFVGSLLLRFSDLVEAIDRLGPQLRTESRPR